MNRTVLCLFYYFPPSGGAGALRNLALVRELLPHGWQATVVAPEGNVYHTDGQELLLDLPAEVEVHRTRDLNLKRPLSLLRRLGVQDSTLTSLHKAILVPDPQWGWAPFAYREADRLLSSRRFDALLSSGAPWTSHLVAARLARRHRIPWAAVFADDWSTSTQSRMATPFHRDWLRHLEGRVLASASAVTPVTEGVARRLEAAHPHLDVKPVVVTNGYDERDFSGRAGRLADRFTLLYAGTMYSETTPEASLQALALLLARRPAWRPRLRYRILGLSNGPFRAKIGRLGLEDVVSLEGPRPHRDAIQAMLDAHLLVDARADQPSAAAMLPVKLLEYLRAGRPILGFYPKGEAADLLARFPDCIRVTPSDAAGGAAVAAAALEDWFSRWERGEWPAAPLRRDGIVTLSRAAQAKRMAEVLDGICR